MAAGQEVVPPPPPGFQLDSAPTPPPGFKLDAPAAMGPKDVPGSAPVPQTKEPSLLQNLTAVPKTALSVASSIPAQLAGRGAAVVHGFLGGQYGTPEGARAAQEFGGRIAEGMTYRPTSPSAQNQLGALGGVLEASRLEGLGPEMSLRGAQAIPRVPQAAGTAARTVREAAPELGMGGIPRPPVAADPTRALAAKATQYGIPLRPDMLSKNKLLKMAGEASEQVPLSGAKAGERQNAFNRALAQTMGAEGVEKLTPDVYAKAIDKYGKMIGDISAKNPVPFAKLKRAIDEHAFNASQFETGDVAKVVGNYVNELTKAGAAKGQIDGTAFRKLRTKLTGQMRRTTNGDLKHALSELDESLLDAMESQLSPAELSQWTQARRFYSNGKVLEPLVAKGTGDISPAALMQRVTADASGKTSMARGTRGAIGDLARIGQQFLKEPASSGTAERGLVYGGLLGGGAMVEPTTAAGLYGAANIYNRAAPWITRRMLRDKGEIPPPPK